jgi:hypothetical protein
MVITKAIRVLMGFENHGEEALTEMVMQLKRIVSALQLRLCLVAT